jgi:ABC-type glutathione transport system ATPase component
VQLSEVSVTYPLRQRQAVNALCGLTCTLRRGEVVGVLGRSGSGKSTLGRLLTGALPESARITQGAVTWDGGRGRAASIPQSPSAVFSPFLRCGEQVRDILLAHGQTVGSADERVRTLLQEAGLPPQRQVDRAFPHELSGGELQRVAVARALAMGPALLVADEATSALDMIQAGFLLDRMKKIREEAGVTILWITHDPSELFHFADRVFTMAQGCIAEEASAAEFAGGRMGPLTGALLDSLGALGAGRVGPQG